MEAISDFSVLLLHFPSTFKSCWFRLLGLLRPCSRHCCSLFQVVICFGLNYWFQVLTFLLAFSLAPLSSTPHIPTRAAFLKHEGRVRLHRESPISLQLGSRSVHVCFHVGSGRRPVAWKGEGNAHRDLGDMQSPIWANWSCPEPAFLGDSTEASGLCCVHQLPGGGSKRVGMRKR